MYVEFPSFHDVKEDIDVLFLLHSLSLSLSLSLHLLPPPHTHTPHSPSISQPSVKTSVTLG